MTVGFKSFAGPAGPGFSVSTVSIPRPASVVSGDVLLLLKVDSGGGGGALFDTGVATIPGWSQKAIDTSNGTTQAWVKTAGGSEPSTYTATLQNATPASPTLNGTTFYIVNYGQSGVPTSCTILPFGDGVTTTLHWPSEIVAAGGTQIWVIADPGNAYTASGMTRRRDGTSASDATIFDATVTAGSTPIRSAVVTSGLPAESHDKTFGFFIAVPSAPSAPTLNSPVSGVGVDALSAVNFTQTYHSTDTAPMNAYALRIKVSAGTYHYWNATAGTLTSTTPVWNTITAVADGQTFTATVPGSVLANGNTYNWSMASQESLSSLQGVFATDATFVTLAAPTVTVTAPTGTITATSAPATTWTETLGSGLSQTAYRAVWESGAYGTMPGSGTPVQDTGVVSSAALTVTPSPLANSVTYRCFVQITQTGNQTSGWAHSDFTLAVTPPNAPTVVLSQVANGTSGMPGVQINVTGTGGGSFDHTNTAYEVQGSSDSGVTWIPVRNSAALLPDGSAKASAVDWEAPLGVRLTYRARTYSTGSNSIVGAWTTV